MAPSGALLELEHVSKSFGSTRALDDVSFDVRPGEVHVLAGENGAGKSTLIRIVAGALRDYAGELRFRGECVRFATPDDAVSRGIATIHQELSLIGSMSVLDNLFLGERQPLFSFDRSRSRQREAERILDTLALEVDPLAMVESLPLSARQLVEIARALARDARVLVMDEPTSALAEPEVDRLFERIARLRDEGRGIVFISHRMEEIFRIADRISVLRDGRRISTRPAAELDERELVSEMVGRELAESASLATKSGSVRLAVRDLALRDPDGTLRPVLAGVSFELRAGEVLGVAGLQGSGRAELCHALGGSFGAALTGALVLDGEAYAPPDPHAAVRRGVVLLPSDRAQSVFPQMSCLANATLSSLADFAPGGFVAFERERRAVSEVTRALELAAPSLDAPAGELSGGNQQKVALARCLLAKPKLLLLDEPTRGIDVGAKADVHALIRRLAGAGTSVILVASEMDELLELSDRVLVLFRGRPVTLLDDSELDRERVLALAMGSAT